MVLSLVPIVQKKHKKKERKAKSWELTRTINESNCFSNSKSSRYCFDSGTT